MLHSIDDTLNLYILKGRRRRRRIVIFAMDPQCECIMVKPLKIKSLAVPVNPPDRQAVEFWNRRVVQNVLLVVGRLFIVLYATRLNIQGNHPECGSYRGAFGRSADKLFGVQNARRSEFFNVQEDIFVRREVNDLGRFIH